MVPARFVVFVFVFVAVSVAPLVFRAPSDPAVAGLLVVPVGGGPPASRPRRELRSARRLEARPGPATAHGHRSQARFEARPCPPVPPAPFAPVVPVVLVCPARPRHRPRASPLMLTNFARNSPTTVSNLECASLELQCFQHLLKLPSNELRATFLEPAVSYVLHQRIQECSVFRGPTVPRGCAWFGHSWGVRTSL